MKSITARSDEGERITACGKLTVVDSNMSISINHGEPNELNFKLSKKMMNQETLIGLFGMEGDVVTVNGFRTRWLNPVTNEMKEYYKCFDIKRGLLDMSVLRKMAEARRAAASSKKQPSPTHTVKEP